MRNIIIVIAFLITSFSFSQGGGKVDAVKFRGKITTAVRDNIDVPLGETWMIHNVTTNTIEVANDDDIWESITSQLTSKLKLDGYTTAERNALDVPLGEVWVIYNTSTGNIEYSEDDDSWQSSGGLQEGLNTVSNGVTFSQGITNSIEIIPDLNGSPTVRIIGGSQSNEVYYLMFDDTVRWSFANSKIYNLNKEGVINSTDLTDKAYVDAEIAALEVTPDNSITENKIVNNAVTTNKLADNAITASKVQDATLSRAKMATSVSNSLDLADTSLQTNAEVVAAVDAELGQTSWKTGADNLGNHEASTNITASINTTHDIGTSSNLFRYMFQRRSVYSGATEFWMSAPTNVVGNKFGFYYVTDPYLGASAIYTLDPTGTPTQATDLITFDYFNNNLPSGSGTPNDGSVTLAKLANGAHGILGYDSGGSPANYAISSAFHSIYSAYSGTSNASPIGTYEVAVRNPNSTSNIEMVPLQAIADLGSGGGTDGMVSDTDGDAGFTIAGFDEIQNFVVGPQAAYDALGSYDDNVFYYIVGLKPATNLASAANTDTTVDLTWTASPDATYVSYYELSIDDGTPTNIGNVTSYTATSLTASTAYNFKVRPSDANGNKGAYTSNVSVTTSAPVPTAIYAGANALDPTNEVDGIANISANTNVSVSSSTTQVDDGTYSIFVDVGTDGNPIDMNLVLQGVTAGQDVTITFMVYRPDGSASNMAGWMRVADGWTSQTGTNIGSLPYDTWRPITLSGVATQNNPAIEIDGSPTGDFYIDNVVITEN